MEGWGKVIEWEVEAWRGGDGRTKEEALNKVGDGGVAKVGEKKGVAEEVIDTAMEEGESGGWGGGGGEDQGGGEKTSKIGVRPSGTGGGGARGWAHRKP